jgi:hypothetical protein
MPHRKRADANQASIVRTLRGVGARVAVTSDVGDGFPDAVCCFRAQVFLLEIKNPDTSHGRAGLSASQQAFAQSLNGVPVYLVTTPDEALMVIGAVEVIP